MTAPQTPAPTKASEITTDSNIANINANNEDSNNQESTSTGTSVNATPSSSLATTSTTSAQPNGPPSPSSTTAAGIGATPEGGPEKGSSGLTKDQMITIGCSIGGGLVGIPGIVIAYLTWKHPKKTQAMAKRFSKLHQ